MERLFARGLLLLAGAVAALAACHINDDQLDGMRCTVGQKDTCGPSSLYVCSPATNTCQRRNGSLDGGLLFGGQVHAPAGESVQVRWDGGAQTFTASTAWQLQLTPEQVAGLTVQSTGASHCTLVGPAVLPAENDVVTTADIYCLPTPVPHDLATADAGALWGDYVSATGSATLGTKAGPRDVLVRHSAEALEVPLAGIACADVAAITDRLGFFSWGCVEDDGGARAVVQRRMKPLSAALSNDGFRPNRVELAFDAGDRVVTLGTPDAGWWRNDFVAWGNGGVVSKAGTIVLVKTNALFQKAIELKGRNQGVVVLNDAVVLLDPNFSDSFVVNVTSGAVGAWIEGRFDSSSRPQVETVINSTEPLTVVDATRVTAARDTVGTNLRTFGVRLAGSLSAATDLTVTGANTGLELGVLTDGGTFTLGSTARHVTFDTVDRGLTAHGLQLVVDGLHVVAFSPERIIGRDAVVIEGVVNSMFWNVTAATPDGNLLGNSIGDNDGNVFGALRFLSTAPRPTHAGSGLSFPLLPDGGLTVLGATVVNTNDHGLQLTADAGRTNLFNVLSVDNAANGVRVVSTGSLTWGAVSSVGNGIDVWLNLGQAPLLDQPWFVPSGNCTSSIAGVSTYVCTVAPFKGSPSSSLTAVDTATIFSDAHGDEVGGLRVLVKSATGTDERSPFLDVVDAGVLGATTTFAHQWRLLPGHTCDELQANLTSGLCTSRGLYSSAEVLGDGIGNDNLLCEPGETCILLRNYGGYFGHGGLVPIVDVPSPVPGAPFRLVAPVQNGY